MIYKSFLDISDSQNDIHVSTAEEFAALVSVMRYTTIKSVVFNCLLWVLAFLLQLIFALLCLLTPGYLVASAFSDPDLLERALSLGWFGCNGGYINTL